MKKSLVFALFALFSAVSFAQISWDAKFGMTLGNVTKAGESKVLPGFTMGVGMDYVLTADEMWSLQSGVMITSKGWKYKSGGLKSTYRPVYLEIPLMGAFKLPVADNMKFVVNAGPYIALGMGGKNKVSGSGSTLSTKLFKNDGMNMRRFDLGMQYGIGLEYGRYLCNLTGQYGFISPVSGSGVKNLNFTIGIGYRF